MIDDALRESLAVAGVTGKRLLVAVSGGRDSIVLLDGMTRLADEFSCDLAVGQEMRRCQRPQRCRR